MVSNRARVHVLLPQLDPNAATEKIIKESFTIAQEFLDHLAVENQTSYRIINHDDCVIWRQTSRLPKLEIRTTLPVTAGASVNPTATNKNGSINPTVAPRSPSAHAAFRYYRFASSSTDLYESYRYLFLGLESVLDDIEPKVNFQQETKWLESALEKARLQYSLELSAYSSNPLRAVLKFIEKQYAAVRCATFHGKVGSLLPGNLKDTQLVHTQLWNLLPIVKSLLKNHFGVQFLSSRMTPSFLNLQLQSLARTLIVSSRSSSDLTQEVNSALDSCGIDDLQKISDEAQREKECAGVLKRAQEVIPFDLLPIKLTGKRPNYEDEWFIEGSIFVPNLRNRDIRSMSLLGRMPTDNVLAQMGIRSLCYKTIPVDLDLNGIGKFAYRIRIVLRAFQEFQKDFASY
jgi:hypothetical protein